MKAQRFGFTQLILTVVGLFLLIRFLPLVFRLAQPILVGGRAFWWAILPLIFGIWIGRKVVGRQRVSAAPKEELEDPPMRDVTNSVEDR